ncbi:glycoside hydrolase family 16 protein [Trametes coccinea BRFM310]|uniref:Glycoside hydrolase family 16 protein n=1 Tax=Trametes coccinea (strain BRFM310) TaxID=1353009 RepID=A0A1Y2IXA3_TRAC3|nr:glycoside hydrolase family 16 protein [Trametes coccinea BRFM310]
MRLHLRLYLSVLFLLSVNPAPSDASLLSRTSDLLSRAAGRVHRRALKRNNGLAEDLRIAFGGMLSKRQQLAARDSQHVYCVPSGKVQNAQGRAGAGSSSAAALSAPSSTDTGSTTSSGTSTATQPTTTSGISSISSAAASPSSMSSSNAPTPSSLWKLAHSYQGETFFDGWEFFTFADPTNGNVQYVDQNTANSSGLIDINSAGHAIMRVETTGQVTGNRKSVRITTTASYTGALVLLDAVHMPTGCGTWPSFWSNGALGEIDIVEGVNDDADNQATLHTADGCTLPSSDSGALGISGSVVGTNCATDQTGNAGCGITATQSNTFGVGFNDNVQWIDSGISVWFFPRNAIPSDISSGAPQPDGWGTPMAHWPASSCNPAQFFSQHTAIFDTTLCGDWAGNAWNSVGSPGQEQSCAQRTGVATCADFVQNNGAAFAEAYWEVNYVKIYQ